MGKVVIVFVVFLACLRSQQHVNSAPVSISRNQTFYDKLYQIQTPSKEMCFSLPKLDDVNYARSMINLICDSRNITEKRVSQVSLCTSLTGLFVKLCEMQNSSNNTIIKVDVQKVEKFEINRTCANFMEILSNTTQIGGDLSSPFTPEVTRGENNDCPSKCKNYDFIREGEEYAQPVHPACILLMKGHKIYYLNLLSRRGTGTNTNNTIQKVAAISVTRNGGVDSASHTIPAKPESNASITLNGGGATLHVAKNEFGKDSIQVTSSTASALTDMNEVKPTEAPLLKPENVKTDDAPLNVETGKVIQILSEIQNVSKQEKSSGAGKTKTNEKINLSGKSQSSTSSSAVATDNGDIMPVDIQFKIKSSTASSTTKLDDAISESQTKEKPDDKVSVSVAAKPEPSIQKSQKPLKIPDDNSNNFMAETEDDGDDDYPVDPNESISKYGVSDKNGNVDSMPMPPPDNANQGYDSMDKPSKNRFKDKFFEESSFGHSTTINVSLKETDDAGFFSYFLFSVTLVALVYLILHNKKKVSIFLSVHC